MKPSAILLGLLLLAAFAGAARADDAPFLWKIQGAKTEHYLLGSVHLLPASAYPLPPPLEAAYAASRMLVFESDLDELNSSKMQRQWQKAARAPQGLAAEIGPELQQRLKLGGENLKLPVARCAPVKAWFCAIALELASLQSAGIEAERGVDQYFHQRAKQDGRAIRWLESPQQQLAVFETMSREQSAEMLDSTLADLSAPGRTAEDLVQLWLAGDLKGFEDSIARTRSEYPGIYARLLADRNRAWLPMLMKGFGGDEPLLIIVGAAHLVGDEGVPALLAASGVDVQRVESKP